MKKKVSFCVVLIASKLCIALEPSNNEIISFITFFGGGVGSFFENFSLKWPESTNKSYEIGDIQILRIHPVPVNFDNLCQSVPLNCALHMVHCRL